MIKKLLLSALLIFSTCGVARAEHIRDVQLNQATAAKRIVCFAVVLESDKVSPATAEAGNQPQISTDGAAFTNTGISVLAAADATHGRYCATVTQAATNSLGVVIRSRFSSMTGAESTGDSLNIVNHDPAEALPYTIRKGDTFLWPMDFVSSTNHFTPVTAGTPSCTRVIDAVATASYMATTNTPTAMTSLGSSSIVISTTDTNGAQFMKLRCTLAGADDYKREFKIQNP